VGVGLKASAARDLLGAGLFEQAQEPVEVVGLPRMGAQGFGRSVDGVHGVSHGLNNVSG
jgi:hypothetical protein